MRKIIILLHLFVITAIAQAQVVNIPDEAKKDFATRYKGATNVDWSNKVTNYQCEFLQKSISCTAFYNVDGTWNYTEKKVPQSKIPAKAKDTFSKSKYRDWELKSIVYIENKEGEKMFRFEAKKGIEKKYVFIDKNGKVVKENMSL